MKQRILIALLFVALFVPSIRAQQIAIKTNLFYWATTTLNVGGEMSVTDNSTVQLFVGGNPWKTSSGKSLRHWVVQPEYRYWFCDVFEGWFVGAHAMGGTFDIANVKRPLGLLPSLKDHRYRGWFLGAGISGGYQWVISKHFNFEASLGIGYDYVKYKKYKGEKNGEKIKSDHYNYVGPTKVALSFLYLF